MTDSNGSSPYTGGTVAQLLGIASDGMELIRQEARLARQETIEKLTPAARSTGMVVGGGLLATLGSTYLLQAVVRLLETFMPRWLASLVSGAGMTAGGLALMQRGGRELQEMSLVPEKTIKSLREDKTWIIRQIKSRLI